MKVDEMGLWFQIITANAFFGAEARAYIAYISYIFQVSEYGKCTAKAKLQAFVMDILFYSWFIWIERAGIVSIVYVSRVLFFLFRFFITVGNSTNDSIKRALSIHLSPLISEFFFLLYKKKEWNQRCSSASVRTSIQQK